LFASWFYCTMEGIFIESIKEEVMLYSLFEKL